MDKADKKYDGEERRKYVRVPYEAVTRYKACKKKAKKKDCGKDDCAKKKKSAHSFSNAGTKNVSSGGILLTTKEHFPLKTILEIEMDIPSMDGYDTVKIYGEIVRTHEIRSGKLYDNGISFYEIDDRDRRAIEQFLEFLPDGDESVIE